MKIAVSTYHNYNSGHLNFIWVDVEQFNSRKEFYSELDKLNLKIWKEDDPEYMFQDYENIPESFISESYISDKLFDLINYDTDIDIEQISEFIEYYGYNIEQIEISDIIQKMEDSFCCIEDDFENYCWEMAECSYGSNIINSGYFDIAKYMNDLGFDLVLINDTYYYNH